LRENLWAPRYVVAFPALAVLLAMGAYAVVVLLWPRSTSIRWRYIAVVGLSIVLATAQTVFYFRDQVPFFVQELQQEDWNDAFFRMVDLPPGTHVHFIMDAPMWDINITAFVGYTRLNLVVDVLRPAQVTQTYLKKISADPATQHVFFIGSGKEDVLAHLGDYFTLAAPQFSSSSTPRQYQLGLYKAIVMGTK
jgi:hypothetical protein